MSSPADGSGEVAGSSRISPTANYTGEVWVRNGLSDGALATAQGRVLYDVVRPLGALAGIVGWPSLERYLLGRHRTIDALLAAAIDAGEVSQVIEVAAGLSGRGLRFARRYGAALTYVETDLPAMAARKLERLRLAGVDPLDATHRVAAVDALRTGGDHSLEALAATLDPGRGLAVITEGLLSYLPLADVTALWRRIATMLGGFVTGRYLTDIHLAVDETVPVRVFAAALGVFVGGSVSAHVDDAAGAIAALRAAGFADARLESPDRLVHILEASTAPRA